MEDLIQSKSVAEGDALIATFMPDMRWIVPPNPKYLPYWRQLDPEEYPIRDFRPGRSLNYSSDWNRLMPVVARINQLCDYHLIIYDAVVEVTNDMGEVIVKTSTTEAHPDIRDAVWATCVNLIEYYNEQNNGTNRD